MDTRFGDIAVGLYDVPSSPEAMVLYLNPLETNAVVFGSSMSGKTTMIKNLLARMNEMEPYRSCENTYILDFGGALSGSGYRSMRRVCACFDNSNEENIKRVFDTVERKLAEKRRQEHVANRKIKYDDKRNYNALNAIRRDSIYKSMTRLEQIQTELDRYWNPRGLEPPKELMEEYERLSPKKMPVPLLRAG